MTIPVVLPGSHREFTRASFAQERLWFIEALDPQSALYNQLICYRITGEVDPVLLQQSVTEVIRRHIALRTNLFVVDGQVYQRSSSLIPELLIIDISDKNEGSALDEAACLLKELARQPYDLANEPLIRLRLIRLGIDDLLLSLITHHTIMDGWSMGILIKEVASIYEALASGLDAKTALPPAGLQYDQYSIRQRAAYDSGEYTTQLEYWMNRLNGDLPILELPFDHLRPALQTYDGKALTLVLPSDLKDALQKVGRKEKATLFMTLFSAFIMLLYRYSGQEDIIVGCPIAGRNQFDVEGMIGLCVNTLAIRAAISPNQSFRELLRHVRSRTLEAYENQDLPFEKLVEKLYVKRSLNVPPVFQTLFQLRNFPAAPRVIGGCQIERYELEEVLVKTDLTLEITDTPDGLSCRFEYPVALFDHVSIVRMAGHWHSLLKDIVKDPDEKISNLQLLTEEETYDMLQMGKGKKSNFPREDIASIFEARAREYPEAIAIRHADERMTYRQVDELSNSLAGRLRELTVRKGDIVVLFMERSTGMVIAMLAILKAGGAYLPISPREPESRIEQMIKSVNARAAITDPGLFSRMEKFLQTVLTVDNGVLAKRPFCNEGDPGPDSLACVMFTSGSTGTPKGVCIPHRGIARLVLNTDYIQLSPNDTVSHLSDPAFDASTFEIWGALLNGATLAVINKDVALSPPGLKSQIIDSHINVLFMTTPLFHAIVSEDPSVLCGLRYLLVGGEVMDPVHAMTFLKHCNTTRFANVYGPTENTTLSTYYDIKLEDCSSESIPIGRPIANSDIYILDNAMHPVPVGITGEIYVSGDGIALGYLESPELTASKFLPDPYVPGQILYKTGDLGKFLPDGNVRFLGRSDTQVKIRGFRVEMGEVASVMETHPAVRQAVITTYQGPGGTISLACYLVKTIESPQVPVEELRQYAAEHLPSHMVPSIFTWMDAIPLTSRGKVNLRALPTHSFIESKSEPDVARDDMTSRMASVWRNVMGLPDAGLDDDFFSIGGHSLLAIRLIASIEEEFKIRLPISAIFTSPTIRSMAALLRDHDNERYSHILIPLKTGGDRPPLYCIHGVSGVVHEFGLFSRKIGDDQPVYGIQSSGLDGKEQPLDSVEAMASRYIEIIRKKQPKGPYHLLAYCAGGVIAYEMARKLEADGEKPGFFGIIDYSAPKQETISLFWFLFMFISDNVGGALNHLKILINENPGKRYEHLKKLPDFIVRKVRTLPVQLSGKVMTLSQRNAQEHLGPASMKVDTPVLTHDSNNAPVGYPDWVLHYPEPQGTVARTIFDAIEAYSPGKYSGKIVLFISTNTIGNSKRRGRYQYDFGWGNITSGSMDIHIIKGDHISIVIAEKNILRITPIIRKEIDLSILQAKNHES
jgi:amino acid adenylation domain-containing protein